MTPEARVASARRFHGRYHVRRTALSRDPTGTGAHRWRPRWTSTQRALTRSPRGPADATPRSAARAAGPRRPRRRRGRASAATALVVAAVVGRAADGPLHLRPGAGQPVGPARARAPCTTSRPWRRSGSSSSRWSSLPRLPARSRPRASGWSASPGRWSADGRPQQRSACRWCSRTSRGYPGLGGAGARRAAAGRRPAPDPRADVLRLARRPRRGRLAGAAPHAVGWLLLVTGFGALLPLLLTGHTGHGDAPGRRGGGADDARRWLPRSGWVACSLWASTCARPTSSPRRCPATAASPSVCFALVAHRASSWAGSPCTEPGELMTHPLRPAAARQDGRARRARRPRPLAPAAHASPPSRRVVRGPSCASRR